MPGKHISNKTREGIIASVKITKNAATTAKEFGVANWTVCRIARQAGEDPTHSRAASQKRAAAIIVAVEATGNIAQVARDFGIRRERVTKVLRAAGIGPANLKASERTRALITQRNADPASPVRVGQLRYALERTTDEQKRALLLRKAEAETKHALLKTIREEKAALQKMQPARRQQIHPMFWQRVPNRATA